MFDTIFGLPVHVLVLHAVVAGVPLMSLVTIVVATRPRWRVSAWVVVLLDAGLLGVTLVTKQSGEVLQKRLGGRIAFEHGQLGSALVWFVVALLVAAVIVALTRGPRRGLAGVALALAIATGVAATYWTVLVGHSGATAVWSGIVQNTKAP